MFFINIKISNLNQKELILKIENSLLNKNGIAIHFAAAHAFVEASQSVELTKIFRTGTVLCDGKPLAKYLESKYQNFEQLRGTAFMRKTLSDKNLNFSHFFLGGTRESLPSLIAKVKEKNNEIRIVGSVSPSFTENLDQLVEEAYKSIANSKPDFIWIGLGAPKQFYIADRLAREFPSACISVGAAFDFISEKSKEAPLFYQKMYLEWFYRLVQDPKRLFKRYTISNLKFIYLLIKDRFLFSN